MFGAAAAKFKHSLARLRSVVSRSDSQTHRTNYRWQIRHPPLNT